MGRFPVGGAATYSDDWGAPRYTPCFHRHQGTDIFAARGTPLRAPDDGVLHLAEEAVGGRVAGVTAADGTYYYLAHLEGFAPDVSSGRKVSRGQVIGFVGSSGNAAGGSPHAHFQIHPRGGGSVNPKPILDAWLEEATATAPSALSALQRGQPRSLTHLAMLRRLDGGSAPIRAGTPEHQSETVRLANELAVALLAPLTPRVLNLVLDGR